MEIKNFVEAVNNSALPFVYSGEKLNAEECQKVLGKIAAGETVLAAFLGIALGGKGKDGIAVSERGIKFSRLGAKINDSSLPVTRTEFPFDEFLVHEVTVKKPAMWPQFTIKMILWDINKHKSLTFQFELVEEGDLNDSMADELAAIFKPLTSKTGSELEDVVQASAENQFHFIWDKTHTTITVNDANIVITKAKVDEKTHIQVPKGDPVTIARSALESIKLKKQFSPMTLMGIMAAGAIIGFILIGGFITLLIFTVLGLFVSFPKTMFINRKDGARYKTIVSGGEDEYERLISAVFK